MPPVIKRRILDTEKWVDEQIKKLKQPAKEPESYVNQVLTFEYVDSVQQDYRDKISVYQHIHRIFEERKISISKDD